MEGDEVFWPLNSDEAIKIAAKSSLRYRKTVEIVAAQAGQAGVILPILFSEMTPATTESNQTFLGTIGDDRIAILELPSDPKKRPTITVRKKPTAR